MTAPTVVNLTRERFDVRVDRWSKWGNPFVIPRDGNRATVIDKYERHIRRQPELLAALSELKGKRLGCHCAPKACHGDVLVRLVVELCP